MTKVKICGITRLDDALAAADSGAWAIGLIFAPGSPRRVDLRRAKSISGRLPKGILKVGVFLDQDEAEILRAREEARLDLLQLHGAEDDAFCRRLGLSRCIKAVTLKDAASLIPARGFRARYLLVDRPRSAEPGPSVDWGLARRLTRARKRVLLAGGLTPENVNQAVLRARPWGVDASSGLESAPGIKDRRRIAAFIAAVRAADARREAA